MTCDVCIYLLVSILCLRYKYFLALILDYIKTGYKCKSSRLIKAFTLTSCARSLLTIFSILSMRSLVCLLCLCLVLAVTGDSAHAQEQPRVARLTRLGCSLDQVIMCSGEIECE